MYLVRKVFVKTCILDSIKQLQGLFLDGRNGFIKLNIRKEDFQIIQTLLYGVT